MRGWQLQEAKAKFSEVIRKAAAGDPQEITVHGEPTAVILSHGQYREMSGGRPRFVAFLRGSPLRGVKLDIERDRSTDRPVGL